MNREDTIRERLEQAIKEKVFPGAAVGIIARDGSRSVLAAGRFTYAPDSLQFGEETAYDTASITKAVPVGLIALSLIENGELRLDDHVITYLPEITIENADKGLLRHLLTYTYVLQKNPDPHFSYEHAKAKDVFDFLYKREFESLPGTHYQYSNAPAVLLGLILERVSGKKLYTLAKELILDPLEMNASTFNPANRQAVPPTENNWRGEIQGEVHDETAFILQKEGRNPGCAGLFSSAGDLLNVAEMILNEGSFGGRKIFSARSVSLMTTNALAPIGQWSGIGWELNQSRFMGAHSHEHMIGKTGFTGTCYVIDPRSGKAMVMLSNRTYPKRPQNSEAVDRVRRDISNMIFAP